MRLSKIHITAISIIVGACLSVGAYGFFFSSIKSKNTEISLLQNQVDLEIRKDQRLRSIKRLRADLGEELARVDTYFIAQDGVVAFLEELEALGNTTGASVDVNAVSVEGGTDPATPYELLEIEFVSRGSWSAVLHLTSLLETLPAGVTINRMQLERLPSSSLWQANMSFDVVKLK